MAATASPLDRYPPPTVSTHRRPGRAPAALIVGVLALVVSLVPLAGAIAGAAAIGLGVSARSEIHRHGLDGEKPAVTGIVLGVLAILASCAALLIATTL